MGLYIAIFLVVPLLLISTAVALEVVAYSNSWNDSDFPEIFLIHCDSKGYDYQSPVYTRLLKEGVEDPIISAVFYGTYSASNESVENDTKWFPAPCECEYKYDEWGNIALIYPPCFTHHQIQNNNGFWWCGTFANFCGRLYLRETLIAFEKNWRWINPFIHWGNYTCQAEQNGTIKEYSFQMQGIFSKGNLPISLLNMYFSLCYRLAVSFGASLFST